MNIPKVLTRFPDAMQKWFATARLSELGALLSLQAGVGVSKREAGDVLKATPSVMGSALGVVRDNRLFFAIVVVPTLLTMFYYGLFATDRFVSEASFVVRTASSQSSGGGLGSFLKITGVSQSQDDTYAVHEFMLSREAVRQIEEKLPLRSMYGISQADFLSRYPSVIYGDTVEELYRYYRTMIEVVAYPATGITALRVQAFRPDDAQRVAETLLSAAERVVNRMNARIQQDAVTTAEAEVTRAEQRMIATQLALAEFRRREEMIDPGRSSIAMAELVGRMSTELAQTLSQLREVEAASPNSPQLLPLRRRVAALEGQINQERGRVSNTSDGLAGKISEYERLALEHEFATRALTAAVSGLETARATALRQLLYLERVVEPHLSDKAMRPYRLRNVVVVFAGGLLAFFVTWLVASGVREHGHSEH
jgi:capsular polysaccharide transport system permease protein